MIREDWSPPNELARSKHFNDWTVAYLELKVSPGEAREKLRLAVRDAKKNPELAKSHKPGQAWEWPRNSPAVKEVRAILTA
jgi:hypothetical protein